MSNTTANLERKISGASDLQSVVRTMKALAASSLSQYEQSVGALADYYRTVELGLGVCFRVAEPVKPLVTRQGRTDAANIRVLVFGSDQGLVGRFNDVVADCAIDTLAALPGKPRVWAIGERVHARLADAGLAPDGLFPLPNSVQGIAPLVARIQIESELRLGESPDACLYVFHNRPQTGALFGPVCQRLLPLDAKWRQDLIKSHWPTDKLPEVIGGKSTLRALISEYLFISLFRACAESLASENASRLAAMQRADKNIAELLASFHATLRSVRQSGIDEELFDVISGFEAIGGRKPGHHG